MFQNVKRFGVAMASVATVLALAAPLPAQARTAESNPEVTISPDNTSVAYWCGSNDNGVKFDTGAFGTHEQGPIKIVIVDETPDRVSDVIDDGTVTPFRVIVNGDGTGNAGNGNNQYSWPTKQDLVPPVPQNGGPSTDVIVVDDLVDTNQSVERIAPDPDPEPDTDINWVIVCYQANEVNDDIATDDTADDDAGDVLGANTDDDATTDDESQVLGAETLANTGVPAGVVSMVGATTLAAAFVLLRSSKVLE